MANAFKFLLSFVNENNKKDCYEVYVQQKGGIAGIYPDFPTRRNARVEIKSKWLGQVYPDKKINSA